MLQLLAVSILWCTHYAHIHASFCYFFLYPWVPLAKQFFSPKCWWLSCLIQSKKAQDHHSLLVIKLKSHVVPVMLGVVGAHFVHKSFNFRAGTCTYFWSDTQIIFCWLESKKKLDIKQNVDWQKSWPHHLPLCIMTSFDFCGEI